MLLVDGPECQRHSLSSPFLNVHNQNSCDGEARFLLLWLWLLTWLWLWLLTSHGAEMQHPLNMEGVE